MNGFDVTFRNDQDWVDFGKSYVNSEAFKSLFREGMTLVEETAAYLDGEGRDESRLISRDATLSYAAESMRLTTLLMQVASWLLVQRAVAEGEMTPAEALLEKHRVKLGASEPPKAQDFNLLPMRLQQLIMRARRLHSRILHLDGLITDDRPTPAPVESPVAAQQGLLRMAFRLSEG
jgi:regulator of CtrA degradation